jgi:hypothetical protein
MALKWADSLKKPSLGGFGIGRYIGWRLDGIGAEQLSRPAEQSAHFIELLLQRRISHISTLLSAAWPHNSPSEWHTE